MNQSKTSVAVTPIVCIECRRPWLVGSERWRLKVLEEESPETVPYCPECAEREFGPASSGPHSFEG
jgi:hypothetical protein